MSYMAHYHVQVLTFDIQIIKNIHYHAHPHNQSCVTIDMTPICEMELLSASASGTPMPDSYQKGKTVVEHSSGNLLFPGMNLWHILLLESIDVVVVQNFRIPVHWQCQLSPISSTTLAQLVGRRAVHTSWFSMCQPAGPHHWTTNRTSHGLRARHSDRDMVKDTRVRGLLPLVFSILDRRRAFSRGDRWLILLAVFGKEAG